MVQRRGNRIHQTLMRLILTGRLHMERNTKLRGLDTDHQRPLRLPL